MYEKIVIGIDSSEYSKAAVIEVSNWIRKHGGSAALVHGVYFDEEEFAYNSEQLNKRIASGKQLCSEIKEMTCNEFELNLEIRVRQGEPQDVIVNNASEMDADMIVMGTFGKNGLKRVLMGSVTSGVIGNAPCDVLVVKKACSECTGEYSSILLPFDDSEFSRNALKKTCLLAKLDGSTVTVLYVVPLYEEMVNFFKTDSIRASMRNEAQKILAIAEGIASSQGVSINLEIAEGHPSEEIVAATERLNSELVVMGTYGWQGINKAIMGSTTERVLGNVSCPVLVIRGDNNERL